MSKDSITILLKLDGEDFEKFKTVSKSKGIRTGKDLVRHLLYDEYNRIVRVSA